MVVRLQLFLLQYIERMPNKETIIQRKVMVIASEYGWIPYRMQVGTFYTTQWTPIKIGLPGTPDLMLIGKDGKVIWFELKTKTGRLRDTQKNFIPILEKMGHKVYVIRSESDAIEALKENE